MSARDGIYQDLSDSKAKGWIEESGSSSGCLSLDITRTEMMHAVVEWVVSSPDPGFRCLSLNLASASLGGCHADWISCAGKNASNSTQHRVNSQCAERILLLLLLLLLPLLHKWSWLWGWGPSAKGQEVFSKIHSGCGDYLWGVGWVKKEEGCFHSLLFLCLNSLQSRITFFKIKENTADKSASTKKRALVLGEKNTDQNLGHLCLLNSPETQSWSFIYATHKPESLQWGAGTVPVSQTRSPCSFSLFFIRGKFAGNLILIDDLASFFRPQLCWGHCSDSCLLGILRSVILRKDSSSRSFL